MVAPFDVKPGHMILAPDSTNLIAPVSTRNFGIMSGYWWSSLRVGNQTSSLWAKNKGDPVYSNYLHPVRPCRIKRVAPCFVEIARLEQPQLVCGACVSMRTHSFARSACSFFGKICSIAPLSSKMGYDAHILAAHSIDSQTDG